MSVEMVKNSVGRMVPTEINGKPAVPFKGVGKYKPEARKYAAKIASCADFPADGNKQVENLKEALIQAGLRDGMTISSHHHFRNGDLIAVQIFKIAQDLGIKDLIWFPSAAFPCQEAIIEQLE
ncbi:MAG: citrate lyase subunit alpha, partial [Deltaproteobacteria bacterium]|nr:citrate lyase subunit alpha [Deltaproteobacteria bacterium]